MKYRLLALLGFLVFVFWLVTSGFWYKQRLEYEIRSSSKIVVTEHSFKADFFSQRTVRQITYREKALTDMETDKLYALIQTLSLKDNSGAAVAACMFSPHHTIKFYKGDNLNSTMDICFECGDVRWDGTIAAQPWFLLHTLRGFITMIGFKPDRDWIALAKRFS